MRRKKKRRKLGSDVMDAAEDTLNYAGRLARIWEKWRDIKETFDKANSSASIKPLPRRGTIVALPDPPEKQPPKKDWRETFLG